MLREPQRGLSLQTSLFESRWNDSEIHNQAGGTNDLYVWKGLKFRSKSEIKIAIALDKLGVLFFPNCKCRLNNGSDRVNREPDFLVLHQGNWGILEVDGEPFHPACRTSTEHKRDRLFKLHGIQNFEHFDASDCYNDPDGVVREFLQIISGGWAA